MAVRDFGNKPSLEAEAEATNPTAGTVMADTGAVSQGGIYTMRITLGANAQAAFDVQRRNAANGANVGDVVTLYAPTSGSGQYVFDYELVVSERVRVVMNANLTGKACAAINFERVS